MIPPPDPLLKHARQAAGDALLVERDPTRVEQGVDLDGVGHADLAQDRVGDHRPHLEVLAASLSVLGTGQDVKVPAKHTQALRCAAISRNKTPSHMMDKIL